MKSFDITFVDNQGNNGLYTFDVEDRNTYDAEFLEVFNEIVIATKEYDIKEITSVECWWDDEE